MIGAIIGDIVGSVYEWNNIKTKKFDLFTSKSKFTDDSVMTIAIAKAIYDSNKDLNKLRKIIAPTLQDIGRHYPNSGYGGSFFNWIYSENSEPYNSYGNGAAMRVSACGFVADTLEEAIELSRIVTEITHNHTEGIKGAEATTVAIYMARQGKSKEDIREYIEENYYDLSFTLNEIRSTYDFDVSCQGTVPQSIVAFLESTDFEDAIRNAISIGGDSDTLAAITGSIAEAYYGVPKNLVNKAMTYLDVRLLNLVQEFNNKYMSHNLSKIQLKLEENKDTKKEVDKTMSKNGKYTQEEVNGTLWRACDTFRGKIDSSTYKDYVLVMLFIKYVSDIYKEHKEELLKKYDNNLEIVSRQMKNERFVLDEVSTFDYIYDKRNQPDIGETINKALAHIEEENKTKLRGVFKNIDFNSESILGNTKERNSMLKNLLEDFTDLDLAPSRLIGEDIIGNAYEYMISNFASDAGKKGGEFFTPSEVSELLSRLVKPVENDRIYERIIQRLIQFNEPQTCCA